MLIVSGLGVSKTKIATHALVDSFGVKDDDIFLNVGICGASREYKIGELIEISKIKYKEQVYLLNEHSQKTITCLDEEAKDDKHQIVDMESYGFYEAVKGMKNACIFKVVSDHFEPHLVTKEKTKMLIFNVIEEIIKKVHN